MFLVVLYVYTMQRFDWTYDSRVETGRRANLDASKTFTLPISVKTIKNSVVLTVTF